MIWTYVIIAVLLLAAELIYFRIADKCNIKGARGQVSGIPFAPWSLVQ